MLSIRSFARAAPRAATRLSSSMIRKPASRPASLLQSTWKPSRTQFAAAFSTSRTLRADLSEQADTELVEKIKSEIQVEASMQDQSSIPTSVKDYMENSPFEILDTPGVEEVVLTRKFNDEKIQVTFSIADINAMDPESDYPDRAMGDEDSENINQGNENNFKVAPEDQVEENEEEGEGEESDSFPTRVNVVVEKPGKGAVSVEAAVQDGIIVIDSVYHFADASLAYAKTADAVHKRQDLYVGPPFGNLDDELQLHFEAWLDVRGINTALAIFVPDYIEMKEQKEYVRWLENVKDFVES